MFDYDAESSTWTCGQGNCVQFEQGIEPKTSSTDSALHNLNVHKNQARFLLINSRDKTIYDHYPVR